MSVISIVNVLLLLVGGICVSIGLTAMIGAYAGFHRPHPWSILLIILGLVLYTIFLFTPNS